MTQPGIQVGLERLVQALQRLNVPFMVVGSVASSIHGVTRATMDVDLVASITEAQMESLAADVAAEFYADAAQMKEAFRRGRSFNLIHFKSSYKFDIFPLAGDAFSQEEFGRRKRALLPGGPSGPPVEFPVASEEDTLLSKLVWFKATGESSERQWEDALGIVRTCAGRLDEAYMRQWAARLRIDDLLTRLLDDARVS